MPRFPARGGKRGARTQKDAVYRDSALQPDAAAAALDLLRALGWMVRHHVGWPGCPGQYVDHLAIGPAGIFVVFDEHSAERAPTRTSDAAGSPWHQTFERARAAADALAMAFPDVAVTPVICFSRVRNVRVASDEAVLCSAQNILEVLTKQPVRVESAIMHQTVRALSGVLMAAEDVPAALAEDRDTAPTYAESILPSPRGTPAEERFADSERLAEEAAERRAAEEAERQAREEAERLAAEEAERQAREEAERLAAEEAERQAREEAERRAAEEADRLAQEEAERVAREEAELRAAQEAERLAAEEAELRAAEEAARLAREEADRLAREEAERLAAEEAERQAREQAEQQAREEAEQQAREEEERLAAEEAERLARLEAERLAQEEAERQAREEAERLEREEAERQAREEEERVAQEEAARKAREEAERLVRQAKREEAERKAQQQAQQRAQRTEEKEQRKAAARAAREEKRAVRKAKAARKAAEKDAARDDELVVEAEPEVPPPDDPDDLERGLGDRVSKVLVTAVILLVVAAGAVVAAPHVDKWLTEAEKIFDEAPPPGFGDTLSVPSNLYHPQLDFVADGVSRSPAGKGRQLVTIRLRIENHGDAAWVTPLWDKLTLVDKVGYSHAPIARKGPGSLPSTVRARGGTTTEGKLYFQLPRGRGIKELQLAPSPEADELLVWRTR